MPDENIYFYIFSRQRIFSDVHVPPLLHRDSRLAPVATRTPPGPHHKAPIRRPSLAAGHLTPPPAPDQVCGSPLPARHTVSVRPPADPFNYNGLPGTQPFRQCRLAPPLTERARRATPPPALLADRVPEIRYPILQYP